MRRTKRIGGRGPHLEYTIGVKIRTRRFEGRCSRHKRYSPAIDGLGGIRGGCPRCMLLAEIWDASLRLNMLIRRFDPRHDDLQKPGSAPGPDPRQMSLLEMVEATGQD